MLVENVIRIANSKKSWQMEWSTEKEKVNIEAETVGYDNVDNFRKCIEIKTHAENF